MGRSSAAMCGTRKLASARVQGRRYTFRNRACVSAYMSLFGSGHRLGEGARLPAPLQVVRCGRLGLALARQARDTHCKTGWQGVAPAIVPSELGAVCGRRRLARSSGNVRGSTHSAHASAAASSPPTVSQLPWRQEVHAWVRASPPVQLGQLKLCAAFAVA